MPLPSHPGQIVFLDTEADTRRVLGVEEVPVEIAWKWDAARTPTARVLCRADTSVRLIRIETEDGALSRCYVQLNVLPHLTRNMPPALSREELDRRYQQDIDGYAHTGAELEVARRWLPEKLRPLVAGVRPLDSYEPNNAFWADVFGTPCFQSYLSFDAVELVFYRRQMPVEPTRLRVILKRVAELIAACERAGWKASGDTSVELAEALLFGALGGELPTDEEESSSEDAALEASVVAALTSLAAPGSLATPTPAAKKTAPPAKKAAPPARKAPVDSPPPVPTEEADGRPAHPGRVLFVDTARGKQMVAEIEKLPPEIAWQAGGATTRIVGDVFGDKRSIQCYGPTEVREKISVTMPCSCGETFSVETAPGSRIRCPACNKPFQFFPGSRWLCSRIQLREEEGEGRAQAHHPRAVLDMALRLLPKPLRRQAAEIHQAEEPEPLDEFWRHYLRGKPFYRTYMRVERARLTLYPQPEMPSEPLLQTQLARELGRLWIDELWGAATEGRRWQPWKEAIRTGARRASKAASHSTMADFLETLVLYVSSRGERHDRCRRLLRGRFALLDGLFGDARIGGARSA